MSTHGIFRVPEPHNEPVLGYEPGSPERDELRGRLEELSSQRLELPLVIGGEDVQTGDTFEAVMPHKRSHVLAADDERDLELLALQLLQAVLQLLTLGRARRVVLDRLVSRLGQDEDPWTAHARRF